MPGVGAQEPSPFHTFTGKTGKTIEVRILSINEDRSTLKLEGRDGSLFDSKITGLSLDDQQFVRKWMAGKASDPSPETARKGRVRAFGTMPENRLFDEELMTRQADFVDVAALKAGWLALRENGEMIACSGRNSGLAGVRYMGANALWSVFAMRNGTVRDRTGRLLFPEKLVSVEQAVCGVAHNAARLRDESVVVWGKAYGSPETPVAPLEPLENIVDIASTRGMAAAVDREGRVYCWDMKNTRIRSKMLGDGVVEVEGSIFNFVALTRSGEVLEWSNADLEKIRRPEIDLRGGKAIAVRAGGATRAAQREDGTWVAWGKNASGIVDRINRLGPVPDIAFFSEPGESVLGYVVWIQP